MEICRSIKLFIHRRKAKVRNLIDHPELLEYRNTYLSSRDDRARHPDRLFNVASHHCDGIVVDISSLCSCGDSAFDLRSVKRFLTTA